MSTTAEQNPSNEHPLPRLLGLPAGSVLEVYPLIGIIDGGLRNISNVEELVRFCQYGPNTYFQEAAISRFIAKRVISDADSTGWRTRMWVSTRATRSSTCVSR